MKKLLFLIVFSLIPMLVLSASSVDEKAIQELKNKILEEELWLQDYGWIEDDARNALVKAKDDVTSAETALQTAKDNVTNMEKKLLEIQAVIDDLSTKANNNTLTVGETVRWNSAWEDQVKAKDDLDFLKSKVESAEKSLKKKNTAVENKQKDLEKAIAKVKPHKDAIASCNHEINELQKDEFGVTPDERAKWEKMNERGAALIAIEQAKKEAEAAAAAANLSGSGNGQPTADIGAADESENAFEIANNDAPNTQSGTAAPSTSVQPQTGSVDVSDDSDEDEVMAGSYTVVKGDNLSKIAKNLLGDANRYPEIIALNKDKYPSLEKNPNLIYAGWVLKMPPPEIASGDNAASASPEIDKLKAAYESAKRNYDAMKNVNAIPEEAKNQVKKIMEDAERAYNNALNPSGSNDKQTRDEEKLHGQTNSTPSTSFPAGTTFSYAVHNELKKACDDALDAFKKIEGTAGLAGEIGKKSAEYYAAKKLLDDYLKACGMSN